jgi:DNA uptake protein ComE-like DNA-binding protein
MRVPGAPDPSRFTWTDSQRRVLLVLLTILLLSLVARYTYNSMYVSDPQPETGSHYADLADRVDPNTVDWQTLAALPGIGERRARDIVEYRERKRAQAHDPTLAVFRAPGDLLYVKGVGVGIVQALDPFLLFPTTNRSSTTRAL